MNQQEEFQIGLKILKGCFYTTTLVPKSVKSNLPKDTPAIYQGKEITSIAVNGESAYGRTPARAQAANQASEIESNLLHEMCWLPIVCLTKKALCLSRTSIFAEPRCTV